MGAMKHFLDDVATDMGEGDITPEVVTEAQRRLDNFIVAEGIVAQFMEHDVRIAEELALERGLEVWRTMKEERGDGV